MNQDCLDEHLGTIATIGFIAMILTMIVLTHIL